MCVCTCMYIIEKWERYHRKTPMVSHCMYVKFACLMARLEIPRGSPWYQLQGPGNFGISPQHE